MIRQFRKLLGSAAYRLIHDWPYIPMERASGRVRQGLGKRVAELPRLKSHAPTGVTLCMLLGAKHADMGLFAAWSILRFLPGARLKIFSDGTLEESHRQAFLRAAEDVDFVEPAERDAAADAFLASRYPLLHRWRRKHVYGAKFTDFHLCGEGDRIVSIDSDILCFSEPTELIRCLAMEEPVMRWNADTRSSYVAPAGVLGAVVGWQVPEKVNTGFLTCRRWQTADWDFFEDFLGKMEAHGLDSGHFWAEQTLYAVAAGLHRSAGPFGDRYSVVKGRTGSDSVVRHYVGARAIRPRFFLEGIPILLKQARGAHGPRPLA